MAPPRPPLPGSDIPPPRPPPPETDDEEEMFMHAPQPNQPIMVRKKCCELKVCIIIYRSPLEKHEKSETFRDFFCTWKNQENFFT